MKQYKYLDTYHNSYLSQNVNMLENINNFGFVRLSIINEVTKEPISYATITFYVTEGEDRDIPIMHLVTTINPVRIELPMAHELGTKIVGPEYNFSTYNISIDVFGYFTRIIYNVRLFPNTTTDFIIEMVPITQVREQPLIEERIELPPHLRDR